MIAQNRIRLLLAVAGLLGINASFHPSNGDEGGVRFYLAEQLDTDLFSALDDQAEGDVLANEPISNPAIELVDYTEQPRSIGYASYMSPVRVGYDSGFVIASGQQQNLNADNLPFLLRLNGWGQLRHTNFNSQGPNPDLNQFQLKRARLVFSGHAFTPDFAYFVQLDGRSSGGDDIRLLDYYMTYDLGHHALGLRRNALEFKTGRYKMPFTLARYLSGREFQFTDRSMASTFFDVNRSLGASLGGERTDWDIPWNWEVAVFNGFVTGGAETGSNGNLDNNFAYSGRIFVFPVGDWGKGQLADFDWHDTIAMRAGIAFANTTIERDGMTEFQSLRVVDSGQRLETLLPFSVHQYAVNQYAVDVSTKWRGWSSTFEYYFRTIGEFEEPVVPQLFDHGFWLQVGKFVVPEKLELLARWSRVVGDSGTLGSMNESSDELAGGIVWYFRDQNAKLTFDFTHLNGAPINSSALDIAPGDVGWLFRTQIQFAF